MNSVTWSAPNIWQLVELCSANVEAIGSNPVEVLNFFLPAKICNCLNWDYNWDDHILILPVLPQFKLFVFIPQFIEHCSADAEAI